jgi:drug/metabolite transporter (DMT)-like permease
MSWIWLTIGAIACRAAYGIFSKTLSRSIPCSSATHGSLQMAVAAVLALIASPALGGLSAAGLGDHAFSVVAIVLASTLGNYLYFRGVKVLTVGVAQIAFSAIIVWGAILSVLFLDSRFSLVQVLGSLLLMFAIWIAQWEPGEQPHKGVIYIIASAAALAVFQVVSATVSNDLTAGTYSTLVYGGTALASVAVLHRRIRGDLPVLRQYRWRAVLAALPASATSFAYYVFAFFAYRHAPDAGVVVILLALQVVLGLLLAMVFLGERRHARRTLLAAVLSVIAAAAIKS